MREPAAAELPEWPDDDSTETFEMIQTSTGEGRKRIRAFFALGMIALGIIIVIATSATWLTTVQRAKAQLFPPPPYTGPVLATIEQDENALWGLNANTGQTVWTYKPISSQSQPLLVDGTIVAVTLNGLVGINQQNGHIIWNKPHSYIDAPPILTVGSAHQVIAWFPTNSDQTQSRYQAIDVQTGKIVWQFQSDGTDYPVAPHTGNTLYFCTINPVTDQEVTAHVVALDTATGTPLWTTRTVQSNLQTQGGSCFVTTNQISIDLHGPSKDDLWAFSLTEGQPLWHRTIPNGISFSDAQRFYSTNWFIDQQQTDPARFTAYDAATGQQLWQIPEQITDLGYQPTVQNGIIGVKTPSGIAGIDINAGMVRWHLDAHENDTSYWITAFDGKYTIFYINQTNLYAVDSDTGTILWKQSIAPNGSLKTIANMTYHAQRVYLTILHSLMVYDAATGKQIWSVPKFLYPLG